MALNNDQQTTAGWIVFAAAVGMMCGMLSIDIVALRSWTDLQTPLFLGTTLGHIGAVITAFVGGKLIPEARGNKNTRSTDEVKHE